MSGPLRLFFAVTPPPALARSIARAGAACAAPGVRPVTGERLHFTLRFLGAVPAGRVPAVMAAATAAAAGQVSFRLGLAGTGVFPPTGRPRVFWLGAGAGRRRLVSLAAALEVSLQAHGFPPADQLFVPHLTVARLDGPAAVAAAGGFAGALGLLRGSFLVDGFALISSRLCSGGPVYRSLALFPLAADGAG